MSVALNKLGHYYKGKMDQVEGKDEKDRFGVLALDYFLDATRTESFYALNNVCALYLNRETDYENMMYKYLMAIDKGNVNLIVDLNDCDSHTVKLQYFMAACDNNIFDNNNYYSYMSLLCIDMHEYDQASKYQYLNSVICSGN